MLLMSVGDEVHDWSHDESEDDQSDLEELSSAPLKTAVATGDGYNSGDLGDESHAYFTEVHGSQSDSDDGAVPRRDFMERFTLTGGESVEQVTIPDKPVPPSHQGIDTSTAARITGSHSPLCLSGEEESTNQIAEPATPPSEDLVARILDKMWHYNLCYTISNAVSECV